MPKTALDYDLVTIFVAVAEDKSFTKAAKRVGIGKGTVSRAIAALEKIVGAELIHRTTHAVALSTAGIALYERTAVHLRALDEAIGNLPERGEQPSGVVRLTAPPDIATSLLPEVLTQFALRYPEVSFDLHIMNATTNLVAEGFDLAIRAVGLGLKDSTLTVRRLGTVSGGFYAAPSYIARRGRPKRISRDQEWILQAATVQRWKLPREQIRFVCDDFAVMRELASEGAGITFLPNYFAAPYVRSGKLESVPIAGLSMTVRLVMLYPSRGQLPRKVIAFRGFLLDWLQKAPFS